MFYDKDRDAFYSKNSPAPSWILDEDTCRWVPPIPRPEVVEKDGRLDLYEWDEDNREWKTIPVILDK